MLMANLTALPAGLNQAHCQPVGCFAKVHEHCSATVRARSPTVAFLPSGARCSLLAALAGSWRTARHSITSSVRESSAGRAHCYVVGCAVDCHAMNSQPFGVFVQALRNTSLRLRGWPLISASIAARPVTSAVSPARRTLRSLQVALLYFVFPERSEASHVALVSVSPEEWV